MDLDSAPQASTSLPELVRYPVGCYSILPPVLSIRRTKEKGRGIWTEAGISAGTIIFSVKPHTHVLSRQQLNLFCTTCCAPGSTTGLKRCTQCRTVYYCGATCQKADWSSHKQECEALQAWEKSSPKESNGASYIIPPEAVRCLARIIRKRKKLSSDSIWWKEINEMQSHRNDHSESMVESHVHLAHALVKFMGIEGPQDLNSYKINSIGELVDLISKFASNSFTLTTPALSPIGVAVCPAAALINHSCDPNVAVVFPRSASTTEEPVLNVVAIQDIPTGSELYTSYIDVTLPTSQRRKELRETYNFSCSCSICSPPLPLEDLRERIWCPKKCGGSCPLPVSEQDVIKCSSCQGAVTNTGEIIDLVRVGNEALEKVTSLEVKDPPEALRLAQNMIHLLESRLPNSAFPLLELIRKSQSLQISMLPEKPSQSQLDELIRTATMNVEGLCKILRFGHPLRALALTELGKLYAVDEPASESERDMTDIVKNNNTIEDAPQIRGPARLRRAIQILQQAYSELCIAFGRKNNGGSVGADVRETLAGLEKELAVWNSGIRNALNDALEENRGKRTRS